MRKRAWLIILGAVALPTLVVGILVLLTHHREPWYHGRSLTQWTEVAIKTPLRDEAAHAEVQAAIHSIGTNALPFLLDEIRLEPSPLRKKLEAYVSKLPRPINTNTFLRSLVSDKADHRSALAVRGFSILDEAAVPAIPRLAEIMNDTNHAFASQRATMALGSFGAAAVPPLMHAAADKHYPFRPAAIEALVQSLEHSHDPQAPRYRLIACASRDQPEALSVLIACAREQDFRVAVVAAGALDLAARSERTPTALSVLTNLLCAGPGTFRLTALGAIAQFGSNAFLAIPALQSATHDPAFPVRDGATKTLLRIAPNAITNAPPP
jgi:HEAT repeat protein